MRDAEAVTDIAVKRIGHKGADHIAPGNTLESFDAALAHGVDMVEFDILPEHPDGYGRLGRRRARRRPQGAGLRAPRPGGAARPRAAGPRPRVDHGAGLAARPAGPRARGPAGLVGPEDAAQPAQPPGHARAGAGAAAGRAPG